MPDVSQPQSESDTPLGVVWVIVNLIVGCKLFSSDRNRCSFFRHPVYTRNISSRNLLKNNRGFSPLLILVAISDITGSIFLAMNMFAYDGAGLDPIAVPKIDFP